MMLARQAEQARQAFSDIEEARRAAEEFGRHLEGTSIVRQAFQDRGLHKQFDMVASVATAFDHLARGNELVPDFSPYIPATIPGFRVDDGNLASGVFARLAESISDFQSTLDDEHEVGVMLVSFGQSMAIHLASVCYKNPALLLFDGWTEDGKHVRLLQHVSQCNVLFTRVKKRPGSTSRIGFIRDSGDETAN